MSILTNNIHLDDMERKTFEQSKHTHLVSELQILKNDNSTNLNPKQIFKFNHPVSEILWCMTDEQREKFAIAHKLKKTKLEEKRNVKKQMDKMLRQVSRARKLYRKFGTDEYLNDLKNKENIHRNLYNVYWYDCNSYVFL